MRRGNLPITQTLHREGKVTTEPPYMGSATITVIKPLEEYRLLGGGEAKWSRSLGLEVLATTLRMNSYRFK